MKLHFVIAAMLAGSVFSTQVIAGEAGKGKMSAMPLEPVIDIHNSPVVQQHPTEIASGPESVSELKTLRKQGEIRERKLRAEYQARGAAYLERFPGD